MQEGETARTVAGWTTYIIGWMDGWMDGWPAGPCSCNYYESITKYYDGRTDRRTDTHSYRDARTHLKSTLGALNFCLVSIGVLLQQ